MLCEVGGALVAQLAVRSDVVVAPAEVLDDHPRFGQCPELLTVEAFIAEASVDSSGARSLPQAARRAPPEGAGNLSTNPFCQGLPGSM